MTRECTYKYLSAGMVPAMRATDPLDSLTRARSIYFFYLPRLKSTLQRVYKEKKVFYYGRCRINLYTPQPRYNFALRKFAAYLWIIIGARNCLRRSFQESDVVIFPSFYINVLQRDLFCLRSVVSVTVARSSLS